MDEDLQTIFVIEITVSFAVLFRIDHFNGVARCERKDKEM